MVNFSPSEEARLPLIPYITDEAREFVDEHWPQIWQSYVANLHSNSYHKVHEIPVTSATYLCEADSDVFKATLHNTTAHMASTWLIQWIRSQGFNDNPYRSRCMISYQNVGDGHIFIRVVYEIYKLNGYLQH
jgi:hypothetical protein